VNKRELRIKAQKRKLQQLEEEEKQAKRAEQKQEIQLQIQVVKKKLEESKPQKAGSSVRAPPGYDANNQLHVKIKNFIMAYKDLHNLHGRAFRILVDTQKEKILQRKKEKLKRQELEKEELISQLDLKSAQNKKKREPLPKNALGITDREQEKRNEMEKSMISKLMKRSDTSVAQSLIRSNSMSSSIRFLDSQGSHLQDENAAALSRPKTIGINIEKLHRPKDEEKIKASKADQNDGSTVQEHQK